MIFQPPIRILQRLQSDEARALSNRSSEVANTTAGQEWSRFFREGAIRGNPETNDSYMLTALSYSYVIRGRSKSFGKRRNYMFERRKSRSGRARF